MSGQRTYLFDGHCVLCSWGVHYVLTYESSPDIRFVAIKSDEGRALALANNIDPDDPKSFLYIDHDQVFHKSDAALALVKHVGGPGKYLLWIKYIPLPLRNLIYTLIARNRYRLFGKTDRCYVPQAGEQTRFVLS